jgi:hypothetical protein
MALFGKADAGLPLTTQFYQLEFPKLEFSASPRMPLPFHGREIDWNALTNEVGSLSEFAAPLVGTELDIWVWRAFLRSQGIETFEKYNSWSQYQLEDIEAGGEIVSDEQRLEKARLDLLLFAELHQPLKRLMDIIADKQVWKRDNLLLASEQDYSLEWLNNLLSRYIGPPRLMPQQIVKPGGFGFLSATTFPFQRYERISEYASHVMYWLLTEVVETNREGKFDRCPVCSSVFKKLRTNMTYCSERCGSRMRMRRNREKKLHVTQLD